MSEVLFNFKRGAAVFAAALLLLALSGSLTRPSFAQEQPPAEQPGAARRARRGPDLLARLSLSAEQLQQLREIRRESEAEARALVRRLRLARRALDEAIYADALDERAVEDRAREVARAQEALVRLRAQTELRVRRVLTPEQLQTFRDLRQRARRQRPDHFRNGRAPDDPGDPPPSRREHRRRP